MSSTRNLVKPKKMNNFTSKIHIFMWWDEKKTKDKQETEKDDFYLQIHTLHEVKQNKHLTIPYLLPT